VGLRSEAGTIHSEKRMLGRLLFLNEYGTTPEWPEGHERRVLEELAEYQPPVLEANPSLLARVARWAERAGARVWQPSLITLTCEFPSALQLRAIRRVFRCPVASSYGSTEAGYVLVECEHGMLHQNVQSCRVDLVPLADGRGGSTAAEIPAGGLGRIAATTFGNTWFPLLRFEVGEMDRALAEVPGLEQYRVDQEAPQRVSCKVIGEPGRGALAALFGAGVEVRAAEVPELRPEKSGKFLLAARLFPLSPNPPEGPRA